MLRLIIIAALVGTFGSCKQGEGDYCQVTDDCKEGLTCNTALSVCQKPGSQPVFDAAPPVDAPLDGPAADGPIADAGTDAPTGDAAAVDAAQ